MNKPNIFKSDSGDYYPIAWRENGQTKIDRCPYCGGNHTHGKGEGHRLQHCDIKYKNTVIEIDGHSFQNNGYIIKEY